MTPSAPSRETMDTAVGLLMDAQVAPDDVVLRGRIEVWLNEAAEHRRAWARAQRAWAVLGDIEPQAPSRNVAPSAQVIPFSEPKATPSRTSKTRRFALGRGFAVLGALAASVALALSLSPSLLLKMSTDYATATGEIRDVRLADGSLVRLGARSAIDVDMSGPERRVSLVAGEAWFDVARDPAHPFVVDTNGVETRVLGTAFEVRAKAEATEVGVARGHVRVSALGRVEDLLPGDRVIVNHASGALREEKVPVASLASWRDGYLFADNATIGEIVDEVRRYDRGWIVLTDGPLAARRITGLYDARNPAAALEAIVAPTGGSVTHVTPYLTIVHAR